MMTMYQKLSIDQTCLNAKALSLLQFILFMSIPQPTRNKVNHLVMIVYLIVDRLIPYFIKFTFPIWALPFLGCMLTLKTINLWRNIFWLLVDLFSPNSLPKLVFAVVKGNGRYLRAHRENVYTEQFYHYTLRKFMTVDELEAGSKVIELQCDNEIGLKFIAQQIKEGKVKGLSGCKNATKNEGLLPMVELTSYSTSTPSQNADCLLLFNYKSKASLFKQSRIDLPQIIQYARNNLAEDGYIVYGDYFEKGEQETYRLMFETFSLRITDEEDLSKNMEYAKKLIAKEKGECEMRVFRWLKRTVEKLLGKQPYEKGKNFHVFILEKNQNQVSSQS